MHHDHELQHDDKEHDDKDHDQNHNISTEDDDTEGTTLGGHEHGGLYGHGPIIDTTELAQDIFEQPQSDVHHYFVTSDATDPKMACEFEGLDPNVDAPTSINRFLTLPTVRKQRHTKIRDPIFDFALSKILTSDEYTTVEEMKLAKEMAEREKDQQRHDKQKLRRRKEREREREEEHSAKAAAHKEAANLKELRAAE
jgi:hypothetical protein